jgi:protoporphyrinogen oxidase
MVKRAIIIGAGPAGLTAAYELLKRTDIQPILLEKSGDIGGISKTVNFKGNRIDIGGHRFFSKSDRVMHWWLQILPLQDTEGDGLTIHYHNQSRKLPANPRANTPLHPLAGLQSAPSSTVLADPAPSGDPDKVMLIRRRLSRIYFLRKFFNYPIKLSVDTLRKLGFARTVSIVFSYIKVRLFPGPKPQTLEDFLIGRFGSRLYEIFFKDYTEKVWGVPCKEISAEWGAQRIKGVSFSKALLHAVRSASRLGKDKGGIYQKDTETSQIERFMYPKLGPGQLWEEVARQVQAMGGEIYMHQDVQVIHSESSKVLAIETVNSQTGERSTFEGDYFFSTMPVSELIAGMKDQVPEAVKKVAAGLQYRDFITVGILLKKLVTPSKRPGQFQELSLKDTWIYIQEKDVKVGRLQLFNNWSPFLVKDPSTTWLGMEYFCNKGDEFWNLTDEAIRQVAAEELEKIGLGRREDVLDTVVIRMEKTYPAYFGTYEQFDLVREYTDGFPNLFLIGRNGMHKYNNSDHSMLTAMVAVDNICNGITDKSNIWSINTEQEYHEEGETTK